MVNYLSRIGALGTLGLALVIPTNYASANINYLERYESRMLREKREAQKRERMSPDAIIVKAVPDPIFNLPLDMRFDFPIMPEERKHDTHK